MTAIPTPHASAKKRKNSNAVHALMVTPIRGQKHVADPANRADVIGLVTRESKQNLEVEAIWGQYVLHPAFDETYVADMRSMAGYLVASSRMRAVADPMDDTYTAPVSAADPGMIKIQGGARI